MAPFTPFLTEHMYQNLRRVADEDDGCAKIVHEKLLHLHRSNELVGFNESSCWCTGTPVFISAMCPNLQSRRRMTGTSRRCARVCASFPGLLRL